MRACSGLTGAACCDRRLLLPGGRRRGRRPAHLSFRLPWRSSRAFSMAWALSSLLSATMTASSALLNASGLLTSAASVSLGNADWRAANAAVGLQPPLKAVSSELSLVAADRPGARYATIRGPR